MEGEDVEFPHGAKAVGHLSQAFDELSRHATLELEDREDFAQPAGRDAGAMQGADISVLDTL